MFSRNSEQESASLQSECMRLEKGRRVVAEAKAKGKKWICGRRKEEKGRRLEQTSSTEQDGILKS